MTRKTIRQWSRNGSDHVDVVYKENPDSSGEYSAVVLPDNSYSPVGAHSSGTAISSVVTLTKPTGASKILIQALTKNIRFTLDGTSPTATLGFQILADAHPIFIEVSGASIKVIEESATASMQYQWLS